MIPRTLSLLAVLTLSAATAAAQDFRGWTVRSTTGAPLKTFTPRGVKGAPLAAGWQSRAADSRPLPSAWSRRDAGTGSSLLSARPRK